MQRYSTNPSSSFGIASETKGEDGDWPVVKRHKRAKHRSPRSLMTTASPQIRSVGPVKEKSMELLLAGDEEAVIRFFRRILAEAQQNLCKKIAKWWIKAINPNKQTNHPYARGSNAKPWWWPSTPPPLKSGEIPKGNAENGFVRHVEPDHLSKPGKE